MTISLDVGLLGDQRPRLESLPKASSSSGAEAVELAAHAGLVLDPWQEYVLEHAMGEDDAGDWSAFEVALLVSRQNGKGSIIEARELAGLFLLGEDLILHSAHEFKTAVDAFRRILFLIESTPDLDAQVARVSRTHGDEGVELKSGSRLKFVARTSGGGRGFSADCVILDEAFNLPDAAISSLMPTLSARPNPQIWYTSSAVNTYEHKYGQVLHRVRERGLTGDDPALAFFEWSVDEDVYRADPEAVAVDPKAWAQANPGLGIRISPDHIEREQRSMTAVQFAVERLGVGRWPRDDGNEPIIPNWDDLADLDSRIDGSMTFALDVAPDRGSAALGVAGHRDDGLMHAEVAVSFSGTGQIVARVADVVARFGGEVVVNPSSPAGSLIPDLEREGVPLRLMRSRDVFQACGQLFDACANDRLRHLAQPSLTDALMGAKRRDVASGGWAWARLDSSIDISPLVAVTNAVWGAATTEVDAEPTVHFL